VLTVRQGEKTVTTAEDFEHGANAASDRAFTRWPPSTRPASQRSSASMRFKSSKTRNTNAWRNQKTQVTRRRWPN
jgi:hypothetical protein